MSRMCVTTKLSAEETARAAFNQFFCHLDSLTNFLQIEVPIFRVNCSSNFCERLHIYRARTTAFRPSANGHVERLNRTLMDSVRCFTSRFPTQWDEYLPQLASAIRSSVNRSTGFTPNKLMLGRENNGPLDLIFPGPDPDETSSYEQYLTDLVKKYTSCS